MTEDRQGHVVPEQDQSITFCCKCFADARGGSWGEGTVQGHCYNCGAGGTTVWLSLWAIDMIRENASWVGKRYYPDSEDKERYEERKSLLAIVREFPGRSVEARETGYVVRQQQPGGWVEITVEAQTPDEALEKARTALPYVPKEKLP